MRQSNAQVSRLAEEHYQVRITRKFCALDVRINGGHERAQQVADYLADGLDSLLDGLAAAVGEEQ